MLDAAFAELTWRATTRLLAWWEGIEELAVASGEFVWDSRSRFGLRPADLPPRESDDQRNIETLLLLL
jgi:hypothetical protein